jgi:hypothetical protein
LFFVKMTMNTMRAGAGVPAWPKADLQAHIAFMHNVNRDGVRRASSHRARAFLFPMARQVRAGKNGAPVTDRVFPESKEFLADFWIVDVDSPDRAHGIAARTSAPPGPGGAPLYMPIELRPIMSAPPQEML